MNAGKDAAGSPRRVVWGWQGRLPKPVLEGSSATYVDVRPGIDLKMVATRSGFEQFFVVKNRRAVPAAGLSLDLPVSVSGGLGLGTTAEGDVLVRDPAGEVVSRIPAPFAWDGAVDQTRGGRDAVSRVPMRTAPGGRGQERRQGPDRMVLTVAPDPAWLTALGRAFPVTVDPSYAAASVNPAFDTFVQSGVGSDQSAAAELKVGSYNGGSTKTRSFVRFPTAPVQGRVTMWRPTMRNYRMNLYNATGSSILAALIARRG